MKIVYCLNSIKGFGGIERVTVKKANSLAAIAGNEVFVLVTDHKRGHIGDVLDESVRLIDLDINYYDDDWQKGWRSRVSQAVKKQKHKKILRETLNGIRPDVVIAVGQSEKFFLTKGFVKTSSPLYVRELHFATDYRILLARSLKSRLLGQMQNFLDYRIMCRWYDAVVCLTPQDLDSKWKNTHNAYFIPNPLTVELPLDKKKRDSKKIISLGRLSHQKNYSSLVRGFSKIASRYPEWVVEIYGTGDEHHLLKNIITNLKLEEQIFLMGHTNEVPEKLDSAAFFVLSSKMEGFPLVLFEAMSHSLPVISYDCPFGPSYIIDDHKNGILVPLHDEDRLAASMEYLILNEDVRLAMGTAARRKAEEFLPEKIAQQWMSFFTELENKRK